MASDKVSSTLQYPSFGDTTKNTFKLFFVNMKYFLWLGLFFTVAFGAINLLSVSIMTSSFNTTNYAGFALVVLMPLILILVNLIPGIIYNLATVELTKQIVAKKEVSGKQALSFAFSKFGKGLEILWYSFIHLLPGLVPFAGVYIAAFFVGLEAYFILGLIAFVAGIYLIGKMIQIYFAYHAFVFHKLEGQAALDWSKKLISGNFWSFFWYAFGFSLIAGLLIMLPFSYLLGAVSSTLGADVVFVIDFIGQWLSSGLLMVFFTLIYIDISVKLTSK
jgi:hypothetical protein